MFLQLLVATTGGATMVQSPFTAAVSTFESFATTRPRLTSSVLALAVGYARCFWPWRAWAQLHIADFSAACYAVATIATRIH